MKAFLKITLSFLPLLLLLFLGDARQVFAQDIFWSQPAKISQSSNDSVAPSVATDSKGYVHAVWMEKTQVYQRPSPGIFYSFWNGDTWSTPQQINSPSRGFAEFPSIAITPNDNIHVVWAEDSTDESEWYSQIYYTSYNGSVWSTPVSISSSLHQFNAAWEYAPRIVADPTNNVHVAFTASNESAAEALLYYTKYNGSIWSPPVDISQGLHDSVSPALAVDSSGNVHALLWDSRNGWYQQGGIYYTFYNGSSWSPLQKMSNFEGDYDWAMFPSLVIDGSGALHGAWYSLNGVTRQAKAEYIRKPSGGSWSSPSTFSTTVAQLAYWIPLIGLTIDSQNNAYVGWGQYNTTWYPDINRYGIDAMYRKYTPSTNTWSNPSLIRSTKYLDAPTIWRDKWWNQHFAWSEMDPVTNQWQFWYSEVPANVDSYSPSSALTITMAVTNDTIKIPASALATTATISAQVGPVPASRDPLVTTIPRSYTFRPQGTSFINGRVATATIRYTDAEVLGSNESQLKAYIWDATANGGLGGWSTAYATSVNTNTNRLSIDLAHFSLYGIMGPRAEREMVLTWKPPISNSELYSMIDNSTLPIKFSLFYEDGTPVETPVLTSDATVYIRQIVNGEISENVALEYEFGTQTNNLLYDPGSSQFLVNLKTKELNLAPGLYNVKVVYKSFTWGSRDFQITEPGKVKGASTP